MIHLAKVEVRGQAEAGEFSGALTFAPGLQVISAHNAYGKSLAVRAIAWCLGLEPLFGNVDNDPVRLPEAVREYIDLDGHANSRVISAESTITIRDDAGRELVITRDIKGGDLASVRVIEKQADGGSRESKLISRYKTMQDEHGGFQRFLFEWMNWPRLKVSTFRPGASEIYLENLAPLFYIDQDEGWSNIQALQIARYAQQEIGEIAVEYLLGALDAVRARVMRLQSEQRARDLKESARLIAERATDTMIRRGWRVEWSSHGSLKEIVSRWSTRKFRDVLSESAHVDIDARKKVVIARSEELRSALTSQPIDPSDTSASIVASQRAISLKEQRHSLNRDLNSLRAQREQASMLLDSLEHRLLGAADLLRLKRSGVGRLDHLECPTCHRDMDASIFGLTSQTPELVEAHIEALRRDRELIKRNLDSLTASVASTTANITEVDSQLRDADQALMTVTNAVGPVREQIAAAASALSATERELERLNDVTKEIDDIQTSIDRWIADARAFESGTLPTPDIAERKLAFTNELRRYLIALGHSAVHQQNAHSLSLDDEYVPFMEGRRLRSLGSASDQSRLIAAYSLALAATSKEMSGKHPGFVVLDEPLQQNPDDKHKKLFLTFLEKQLAQQSKFQTLIFTWLTDKEIGQLRKQNTTVITPEGHHFLQLTPKTAEPIAEPTQTVPQAPN